MARTLIQVDTDLANLEGRVKQLDGVGLTDPTTSTLAGIIRDLNGVIETVRQTALVSQSQIDDILASIKILTDRLNNL